MRDRQRHQSPSQRPPGDAGEAIGALYDAHGPALYRYALLLTARPTAAEDAIQQAFAKLLAMGPNLRDYGGPAGLATGWSDWGVYVRFGPD